MKEQPGGEEQGGALGRKRGRERQPGVLGRGEPQAHVIRMALGRVGGLRERSLLQTAASSAVAAAAGLGPSGSQDSTGMGGV